MKVRSVGLLTFVLAVGTLAAACAETPPPALPTPDTSPRTSTTLGREKKDALLTIGQVRQSDLGEGWEQDENAKAGFEVDAVADLQALPACQELLDSFKLLQESGAETKRSPVFKDSDRVVSNTVTVLNSSRNAAQLTTNLNSVDVQACLTKAYESALAKQMNSIVDGATLSSVRVRRLDLLGVGESRSVLEVTIDFQKDGAFRTIVFTRAAVQSGPVVQEFNIRSERTAPNTKTIIEPSVERVRNCVDKNQCAT